MREKEKISSIRTKNVYLNSTIALTGQIVQIILGFLVRRLFILSLGNSYLGYESVFSNILQMLNIADLGISVAVTSFMYVPLARREYDAVTALMYLYKRVYQVIGIFVLVLGMAVSVFLPVLISDAACSTAELRFYFYISLAGTVSTYYLSYRRTLLTADQKSYFVMLVDTALFIIMSVLQLFLLSYHPSYVLYLITVVLKNITANIIISSYCEKKYDCLKDSVNREKYDKYKPQVFRYVKELFVAKIGSYVFYSTDNLVLSIFRGSVQAGYLSNYNMIILQVNGVIGQILSSVQSVYGNYISETEDKNAQRKMTDYYFFVTEFLGIFCMLCVIFMIQPFVRIFFGKLYVLDTSTAVFMGINLMLMIMQQLPSQIFAIYRLYRYDRPIIVVSAALNIVISVALVQKAGINGVLVGTCVSALIYIFSRFYIIAKYVYNIPYRHYVYRIGKYFCVAAVSAVLIYTATKGISGDTFLSFGIKSFCVVILSVVITLSFFATSEEFHFVIDTMIPVRYRRFFSKYVIWGISIVIFTLVVAGGNYKLYSDVADYNGNKSGVREDSYRREYQAFEEKEMHVSFDDVIDVFIDLTKHAEEYDSIFDNEFLAWLRELHENWGMKAACYVFYQEGSFSLADCPKKFRSEFAENAEWLKFGFHSLDGTMAYGNSDSSLAEDYQKTMECLIQIVGKEAITDVIRLHCFAGTRQEIEGLMSNPEVPVKALLCADDRRGSYYLTQAENDYIYCHDEFVEKNTQMRFISTDIRMEYVDSMEDKIEEFAGTSWNNQLDEMVVFTHEWAVDDDVRYKIDALLMWAVTNGYQFSFLE